MLNVSGSPLPTGDAMGMVTGAVKWFDGVRGYGFIIPEDGSADVLVHFSVLKDLGRRTLPEGARLTCLVSERERGRQAQRVLDLDLACATPQMPSRRRPALPHESTRDRCLTMRPSSSLCA